MNIKGKDIYIKQNSYASQYLHSIIDYLPNPSTLHSHSAELVSSFPLTINPPSVAADAITCPPASEHFCVAVELHPPTPIYIDGRAAATIVSLYLATN